MSDKHYYGNTRGGSGLDELLLRALFKDNNVPVRQPKKERDPIQSFLKMTKGMEELKKFIKDQEKGGEKKEEPKGKGEWIFIPERKPAMVPLPVAVALAIVVGPFVGLAYIGIMNMVFNALK
jgi:hypothetical protein